MFAALFLGCGGAPQPVEHAPGTLPAVAPAPAPPAVEPRREPRRVTASGRVLDEAGAPRADVMVHGGGGVEAVTGPDGRWSMELDLDSKDQTVRAFALGHDCEDIGDCGISEEPEIVPDAITLTELAAAGFSHDFQLPKRRPVRITTRVPGEGWPLVQFTCSDPDRDERNVHCVSVDGRPADCGCPPGDATLEVYQAGLQLEVPAAATSVEVDLRAFGGLSGRLVRGGAPAFARLSVVDDPAGELRGTPQDGAFTFGPLPVRPVHLVAEDRAGVRTDLGVFTPGRPTSDVGDLEVPPFHPE